MGARPMSGAAPKGDRIPAPPQGFELVGRANQGAVPAPPPGFEMVNEAPASYEGTTFDALTEGSHAGVFGGWDDEIAAAGLAPVNASIDWARGRGFDVSRAYTEKQQMMDARKDARREAHPVASVAGEVAGGLAVPGLGRGRAAVAVANAPSTVGSSILKGLGQGAGWGAVVGAGEAKPGERLAGAGKGALIGGVTGGVVGGIGGAIAGRATNKAIEAATPTSDELAGVAQNLYRQSEQQGVRFAGNAVTGLKNRLLYAAGQANSKLRPKTAGTADDVNRLFANGKDMSLEAFDEFRKGVNLDLRAAEGSDKLQLTRMKQALDDFADKIAPTDMTGGPQGIPMLKEARKIWAQHKKAQTIESILDNADVKTGQYTQSGFANAIKTEMRGLYRAIQKGKAQGWTKEEIALIRQMAKGGSPSTLVNVFSKFAPRGVVSIGAGQVVGSSVPFVGNVAVPVLGHLAGKAADRGAMSAASTLRNAAAAGVSPKALPNVPNKLLPLIPAASGESTAILRRQGG